MKTRKIICLLLAAIMVIGSCVICAAAKDEHPDLLAGDADRDGDVGNFKKPFNGFGKVCAAVVKGPAAIGRQQHLCARRPQNANDPLGAENCVFFCEVDNKSYLHLELKVEC